MAQDKTQKMPEAKTTKINRPQTGAATSTPKHAKTGVNAQDNPSQPKRGKGKLVAVIVTIVLLVCALLLSLAWGAGLFTNQEQPKEEETSHVEDAANNESSTQTVQGDDSDVSYTRYATGDISLEYPSSWSVMSYESAQTIVVTRGTVADGFIKLASANVSDYASSAVVDAQTMRSFVADLAAYEGYDVDTSSLAIGQRGDVWTTTFSIEDEVEGKDMRGVQLVGAIGDTAYVITAQCPSDTYSSTWPYFQHVLDSMSFDAGAEFPDEGRD